MFVLPNGESALFHSWSCLIVIHYTGITTQLITKTCKHKNGKYRNVNTNMYLIKKTGDSCLLALHYTGIFIGIYKNSQIKAYKNKYT